MKKIGYIRSTLFCFFLLTASMADLIPNARAVSPMTASDACVELIKEFEGFSPQPYYDYSQYTVGYGTKCPSEKYFTYMANGIPRNEAEALLREEIADIEDTLNTKFIEKYSLTFTQHQFDALVSFSYNIGTGWLTYDSTLRSAILSNADDNDLVYAFGLYCSADGKYLPGLVTRRLCEANLYLNGIYSPHMSSDFGYVYYDANGGTVAYRVQAFLCAGNAAPVENAVRNGDTFLGWYTNLTGGSQVSELTGAMTGKTLFARWETSDNTDDQDSSATTILVTGDVVNIRTGPGTNYAIAARAYRNDVLTVSHVTHLTNRKWGKVHNGWICLEYTNYDAVVSGTDSSRPSPEPVLPDSNSGADHPDTNTPDNRQMVTGVVRVNDLLRIRSGPGTTYTAVGFLFNNKEVEILEQKTSGSMVWGRIDRGWVCMDYIVLDTPYREETAAPESSRPPEPEKAPVEETPVSPGDVNLTSISGTVTADMLRIRSGAGTTTPIIGFYFQSDRVVVTKQVLVDSVFWGKTDRGWISMEYVLADSPDTEPEQPLPGTEPTEPVPGEAAGQPVPDEAPTTTVSGERKTVIGDGLRIRAEAGTTHKIVGFLYTGDQVAILETKTLDGVLWGRIDRGWISMEYVR